MDSRELCDRAYAYLSDKQKHDSALVCYSVVANRYYEGRRSKEDLRLAANAMYNLGIMHMSFYMDYEKAMEYLLQAERLSKENDIPDVLPAVCSAEANVIMMTYGSPQKHKEKVMAKLKEAYGYALQQNDVHQGIVVLNNMISHAVSFHREKDIAQEAAAFLRRHEADTTAYVAYTCQRCRAVALALKGQTAEAAQLMQQAAAITWDELLQERMQITTFDDAGSYYVRSKRYAQAIEVYHQAGRLLAVEGCSDYASTYYQALSHVYTLLNDTAMAQHYDYLHLKAADSLMTAGRLAGAGSVEMREQLAHVNHDMCLLSERHRLLTCFLWAAVAVVVLISLLLWRLYRTYRKVSDAHRHLYEQNVQLLRQEEEKVLQKAVARPVIDETEEKQLFDKITHVLQHCDEVFTTGFTMGRMAELVGSNSKYVSQAVNSQTGQNFSTLLSDYRVREACRRLNDQPAYGKMTIEAIAESVGIKSRSNFTTVFKRFTGLTPSEYMQLAKSR